MEFWGVEVKPNETLKCEPGDEKYLHLSQVTLGEMKKDKGAENVTVFVKFNDQKLVLGTLSAEKFPQISYDLVFEKEFELSHSSKNTSLYFCGYKTATMDEHSDLSGDEFDSDEEPIPILSANGNSKEEVAKPAAAKAAAGKADASLAKPKAKAEEPIKAGKLKAEADDEDDDDEDDDEDDEDIDEDESDDEDMLDADDSDDDDEDNSDEEEEETPKKVESAKKRSSDSASKTPVPAKKAKVVSPVGAQKTGGS
ncbi:Histone deacetylase protein [Dioscorea alata]|uniref:Histone deacetylase protein n=1 Tax=Dioscorea alata TaxID=55571 RepID=A0ACB7US21_DIOAL|nr:Histone deacetylase protein [Dioscorea alata]